MKKCLEELKGGLVPYTGPSIECLGIEHGQVYDRTVVLIAEALEKLAKESNIVVNCDSGICINIDDNIPDTLSKIITRVTNLTSSDLQVYTDLSCISQVSKYASFISSAAFTFTVSNKTFGYSFEDLTTALPIGVGLVSVQVKTKKQLSTKIKGYIKLEGINDSVDILLTFRSPEGIIKLTNSITVDTQESYSKTTFLKIASFNSTTLFTQEDVNTAINLILCDLKRLLTSVIYVTSTGGSTTSEILTSHANQLCEALDILNNLSDYELDVVDENNNITKRPLSDILSTMSIELYKQIKTLNDLIDEAQRLKDILDNCCLNKNLKCPSCDEEEEDDEPKPDGPNDPDGPNPPPPPGECVRDNQCPNCEVCVGGLCVPLSCPEGECDPLSGICVPCINQTVCPDGNPCLNGNCGCPPGTTLTNGVCIGEPCTTTCPSGQLCVEGNCIPISCPPGFVLVNGTCEPRCICGQNNCVGQNSTCIQVSPGICVCRECEGSCSNNSQCGEGCYCTGSSCEPNPCSNTSCTTGLDCGEGCACDGSQCLPCDSLPCNEICSNSNNCACIDNTCASTVCQGDCLTPADCLGPTCGCYAEVCVPCEALNCVQCALTQGCVCNDEVCEYSPCSGDCDSLRPCSFGDCGCDLTKNRCTDCNKVNCSDISDCPQGCDCIFGKCSRSECQSVICTNSNDCGEDCTCLDGVCVSCSQFSCSTAQCDQIPGCSCNGLTCEADPPTPCDDELSITKGDCELIVSINTDNCCQCTEITNSFVTSNFNNSGSGFSIRIDTQLRKGSIVNYSQLNTIPLLSLSGIDGDVPETGSIKLIRLVTARRVDQLGNILVSSPIHYIEDTVPVNFTNTDQGFVLFAQPDLDSVITHNGLTYKVTRIEIFVDHNITIKPRTRCEYQSLRHTLYDWNSMSQVQNGLGRVYRLKRLNNCRAPRIDLFRSSTIPGVLNPLSRVLSTYPQLESGSYIYNWEDLIGLQYYRVAADCICDTDKILMCPGTFNPEPLFFCNPINASGIINTCNNTFKFENDVLQNCDIYNPELQYELYINFTLVTTYNTNDGIIAPGGVTISIPNALANAATEITLRPIVDTCEDCEITIPFVKESICLSYSCVTGLVLPSGSATINGAPVFNNQPLDAGEYEVIVNQSGNIYPLNLTVPQCKICDPECETTGCETLQRSQFFTDVNVSWTEEAFITTIEEFSIFGTWTGLVYSGGSNFSGFPYTLLEIDSDISIPDVILEDCPCTTNPCDSACTNPTQQRLWQNILNSVDAEDFLFETTQCRGVSVLTYPTCYSWKIVTLFVTNGAPTNYYTITHGYDHLTGTTYNYITGFGSFSELTGAQNIVYGCGNSEFLNTEIVDLSCCIDAVPNLGLDECPEFCIEPEPPDSCAIQTVFATNISIAFENCTSRLLDIDFDGVVTDVSLVDAPSGITVDSIGENDPSNWFIVTNEDIITGSYTISFTDENDCVYYHTFFLNCDGCETCDFALHGVGRLHALRIAGTPLVLGSDIRVQCEDSVVTYTPNEVAFKTAIESLLVNGFDCGSIDIIVTCENGEDYDTNNCNDGYTGFDYDEWVKIQINNTSSVGFEGAYWNSPTCLVPIEENFCCQSGGCNVQYIYGAGKMNSMTVGVNTYNFLAQPAPIDDAVAQCFDGELSFSNIPGVLAAIEYVHIQEGAPLTYCVQVECFPYDSDLDVNNCLSTVPNQNAFVRISLINSTLTVLKANWTGAGYTDCDFTAVDGCL